MLRNVTLSADEKLIQRARQKAMREHSTLNMQFRAWLERYVGAEARTTEYQDLMGRLAYAQSGRKYSRDELNER